MHGQEGVALLGGVVGLHVQHDARPFRECAHGLHETQAVLGHQELEDIPVRGTAEAVVGLAGGVDVEGGRLLLVKRAARLEGSGGALELHPRADEFDDVGAVADLLDHPVCDALGHSIFLRRQLCRQLYR